MAGASLFFDIFARDTNVSDTLDKIGKKAQDTDGKVGKFGAGLAGLAAPAAVGIAAAGALAIKFGEMAADAEQNVGAVETVFGAAAGKVQEFASKSAEAVGLSQSQYNQLSATTGTALKAAGVSVDQLAEKNDELIKRGADMASVFGGTTVDAVSAMGSAFRGEFDPLERYGVTLTMNQVNAELAARGQDKLGGAALESAKKQAIMDIVMQQSAASAGNFAKEADTTAGAQQRATANFADASAKLGEALLPAMTKLAEIVSVASKWIAENSDLVGQLAIVLGVLAGGVVVASGAMTVFNLVAAANPVGAVILAVTALIAVIALLAMNWDKVVAFITDKWNGLTGWWSDGMRKIGDQWNGFWGGINTTATNIWNNGVKPVFDALNRFVTQDIPNSFKTGVEWVATHWNKLQDIAKAPVRFLVNTVINDGLIGTFNTVAGWVGIGKLGRVALPPGFADGGYTGEGSKHDPAGIVHKGEFVLTKEETAAAGVNNLRRLARSLRGFADGGFVDPAPGAVVSQGYSGLSGHNGIDLAGPIGMHIRAAERGNVVFAGWSNMGGGNEMHIKHPGGLETWYAHLSKIRINAGMNVQKGQWIGDMGSTGNSTGSHLHYMVLNGGWPNVMNPGPYMNGGAGIPEGGIPFDPIGAIAGGLIGALKGAFDSDNLAAKIAVGIGSKILGDFGNFVKGAMGMGGTYGPKVYDAGGWMDSVGVNRTGRPEPVFTDPQWNSIHTLASRGASLDGYTLELNADMTRATLRRDARAVAEEVLTDVGNDIYRGRAR
jgi:murein DD-endopeptidase MepM/ murein hydrolase activator NlpD